VTNGIVIGVVEDLDDREGIARVRAKLPHLGDKLSDWARLVTPMGGKDRGVFFRPEKGDEVLVAFEHGDPRRPYVLGSVWSKTDPPPADDGKRTKNNWRFIRSRSGHTMTFDDTANAEKIEIVGKGGQQKIVIDVSGKKITITCDAGDIEVKASAGAVKIEAAQNLDMTAKGNVSVKAEGNLTLEGKIVNINP